MVRSRWLRAALTGGAAALVSISAGSVSSAPATPAPPLPIVYVGGSYPKPESLSLIQNAPDDAGVAGIDLALKEIGIAGRFLGRSYTLDKLILKPGAAAADQLRPALEKSKILVADLDPDDLTALADMPEAKDALILDMRTSADELRGEKCKLNTFHLLPSTAMRTDALGQYLVAKRWTRWFLLAGTSPCASLASTTGRIGAITGMARSSATSSAVGSSRCCPIASAPRRKPGWRCAQRSRSSRETAAVPIAKRLRRHCRTPPRSPIVGI